MRPVAALLVAVTALTAPAAAEPTPLRGPISDFWNQVRREWARKIPGLRQGTDQTSQWVSLIYGGDGDDALLDDILEREMLTWAKWQRRNWVRSEFWRMPYDRLDRNSFYGSRGLRQNLVVMGTLATNAMIGEMTAGTPFRLEGDRVWIGAREYRGPSLVLVFLRRNPFDPSRYALVLAATGVEGLLDLGRLPIGATDYVLFRGAHAIDVGFLDWSDEGPLALTEEREIRPDHQGWGEATHGPVTVHFHPEEFAAAEADAIARERATRITGIARRFGLDDPERLDVYLYATAEAKLRQTGEPGPVSADLAGGAVHRVQTPTFPERGLAGAPPGGLPDGLQSEFPGAHEDGLPSGLPDAPAAAWPETMALLWRGWGPTSLKGLLFGLALVADSQFEGRSLDEWATRLAASGRLRPVEELLRDGPPWRDDDPDGALQALALGSFLAALERAHGMESLAEFYRRARARSYRAVFREILPTSLAQADHEWRSGLRDAAGARVDGARAPGADPGEPGRLADPGPASLATAALAAAETLFRDRQDGQAEARAREALELNPDLAAAHLLAARVAFRAGRDAAALAEAEAALRLAPGDAAVRSWARVTRGRAHAVRGELQSARLELDATDVRQGPPEPRLLAEVWLENLGLSPSRAAAARYLAEQAEIDLQRFDWDEAEQGALRILRADPGDASAHHLLARIRMEKFGYWYNFISLYNELFPSTTRSDPMQYFHLAQSSGHESLKGAYLDAGALSLLELDRTRSRDLRDAWTPEELYPTSRVPDEFSEAAHHVLRGRGFLLAGDYRRAASQFRAALAMRIPVSDSRAWTLSLLARCESALGEAEAARGHLREALGMTRRASLVRELEAALQALDAAPEP